MVVSRPPEPDGVSPSIRLAWSFSDPLRRIVERSVGSSRSIRLARSFSDPLRRIVAGSAVTGSGREHGDREAFLARVRARQGPPPVIGPHPPPPPPVVVPEVRYRSLDGVDPGDPAALRPAFVAAARRAAAVVHDGDELSSVVAAIVDEHGVQRAVVSAEPEVLAVGELLAGLGVAVAAYDPVAGAAADLGVTSAVAGIAATGSVVVDAGVAGGRGASLLPPVHLCVLPADRLIATPSDVFRRGSRPLPSNRVVITGPSRTGDIEQIITTGAHGPVAVHILVV